jgi:eukaryotic-like serine/threonine-protein kinase
VFWSADSKRINFQRSHAGDALNAASDYADSVLVASGKVTSSVPNIRMSSGSALPDGRIIFLRTERPDSAASDQIWEVPADPATGTFLEAPHRIGRVPKSQLRMSGMTVTSDGKRVMVLLGSHLGGVFVGDLKESPPVISGLRLLTPLDDRTNYPHAWTPDSNAVIFESNRNGSFDLFKQDLNEKTPSVVVATPRTEMLAQMGPHGRLLYAVRDEGGGVTDFGLMQTSLVGGPPADVPIGGILDEFRCALRPNNGCVLRTTAQGESYSYYELDPINGKGRELARTKWTSAWLGNWDVSPDGKEIALPDHDSTSARIRVISLVAHRNLPREHEVVLAAPAYIRGLVWAPSGRGWFVSVQTAVGNRMLYVYRDGRFSPLGDIWGWAVPSPDGKRIATWNHTGATNAWLVDRR